MNLVGLQEKNIADMEFKPTDTHTERGLYYFS